MDNKAFLVGKLLKTNKQVGKLGGEQFFLREVDKLLIMGSNRKALSLLEKYLEKKRKDYSLNEVLTMRIGKKYMRAGLRILRQYQQRSDFSTKDKTVIILNKLQSMIILWYYSIVKYLDKRKKPNDHQQQHQEQQQQFQNQSIEDSFNNQESEHLGTNNILNDKDIKADQQKQNDPITNLLIEENKQNESKPSNESETNENESNMNEEQQLRNEQKKVSKFCKFIEEVLEKGDQISINTTQPTKQQQLHTLKNVTMPIEVLMIPLIHPTRIHQLQNEINIKDNIEELWVNIIELLNIWAAYLKKKSDLKTSLKLIKSSEKILSLSAFKKTKNVRILDVAWKTHIQKASMFLELRMFSEAENAYEECIEWKQREIEVRLKTKNDLPHNTATSVADQMSEKSEKSISQMCMTLLGLHIAYEQQENAEKANECLKLAYWFSSNFLNSQYSDLKLECMRAYKSLTSVYEELILMNSEINKIMGLALGRGGDIKKFELNSNLLESANYDQGNGFLKKIDSFLYQKSQAAELNSSQLIFYKKRDSEPLQQPQIKSIHSIKQQYQSQQQDDTFNVNGNKNSNQAIIVHEFPLNINLQPEDQDTIKSKPNHEQSIQNPSDRKKTEESMQSSILQCLNTTTASSKKDFNKTTNSSTDVQFHLQNEGNKESNSKINLLQGRIVKNIISNNSAGLAAYIGNDYQLNNGIYNMSKKGVFSEHSRESNSLKTSVPSSSRSNIYSNWQLNSNSQLHSALSFNVLSTIQSNEHSRQNINLPQKSTSKGERINFIDAVKSVSHHPSNSHSGWQRFNLDKKKLQQLKKVNDQNSIDKYQPHLVSSNKFFMDKVLNHETDAKFLEDSQKELEIEQIFGVHKRKNMYNLLSHDVNTFANDLIAREILSASNCMTYSSLSNQTQQNLIDSRQEKSEFSFCRKVLGIKKANKIQEKQEDMSDINSNILDHKVKREADEIYETISLKQEVTSKKKQIEEVKRIQSINLQIHETSIKDQPAALTKFKKIMLEHSKKLGFNEIKKSLKKMTTVNQLPKQKEQTQNEIPFNKNLIPFLNKIRTKRGLFEEEEENLDDAGKLAKVQNINRQTIRFQLNEIESTLQQGQKKDGKSVGWRENQERELPSIEGKEQFTIGEILSMNYQNLSSSTKHFVAKNTSGRINTFADLINAKIRENALQKLSQQQGYSTQTEPKENILPSNSVQSLYQF